MWVGEEKKGKEPAYIFPLHLEIIYIIIIFT